MKHIPYLCLRALLLAVATNLVVVHAINFSFPVSAMYSCSGHCQTLNMQCAELSTYNCADAAKQVTHRKSMSEMNSIKTDCSTGGGCFVDRFSLIYSELITNVNSTTDTCGVVPVCTDIHGGSLQTMKLLCGCIPLESEEGSQQTISHVELTSFQLIGIASLLLSATGLLLFLLRKCCSATLFLRYRELEDDEEAMEHFLKKELTLRTRMAWCLCYEPCVAMFTACPVIVQEFPLMVDRLVDRLLDMLDCFSLLSGNRDDDQDDEDEEEEEEEEDEEVVGGYARDLEASGGGGSDGDNDSDIPRRPRAQYTPSTASSARGAYTTAKRSERNTFTSKKHNSNNKSAKINHTDYNNRNDSNNSNVNNKFLKGSSVQMTPQSGRFSSNRHVVSRGGERGGKQGYRAQRRPQDKYNDSNSDESGSSSGSSSSGSRSSSGSYSSSSSSEYSD